MSTMSTSTLSGSASPNGDYDPVANLNILFGNASAVGSVAAVSQRLRLHTDSLSASIASLETAQAYGSGSSLDRMQAAQSELASVFARIQDVRDRAVQTEEDITIMTADIKRLDGTKRNLTVSMTALKRLQMLTTAYEQLHGLARTRQYRDCAGLLQAVLQLMRHFHSYRSIEQIAVLSRGVGELQRELLEQVCEDFELAFSKDEVAARRGVLAEACLVVDALGDQARARLVTWYVNTELREYRQVFRGSDEAGSLDNIDRRYAWFRRTLKTHEEEHAALFPAHWRVNEALATAFCDGTRDDFRGILERSMRRVDGTAMGSASSTSSSGSSIDVNLLLRCLQETLDFEHMLERRFASHTNERQPRASIDTLSSGADERTHSFHGSISVAFEPYLSLWVELQDRQLAALIPKYRAQRLVAEDDEFSPESVAPSALELFHVYKTTLSQCAKLSTGERLLDLTRILAKYLDEYAQQVLLPALQVPGLGGGGGGGGSAGAGAGAGGAAGAPVNDAIVVLNTADFWHRNTTQLENSLKKRIDAELAERVDLSAQADAFLGVAGSVVQMLVRKVELACEGPWREMRNTNWSRMEGVGDHSTYVTELIKAIRERAEAILAVVAQPQYARAFCDHVVEAVAAAYLANIVQCRPVSEVAAEQMLLDKYTLTKALETLLSLHGPSAAPLAAPGQPAAPPSVALASFVKRVNHSMAKVDPLLKTLQVRASPPEGLVQAYLIHIADRSEANFRKILDLKGVRKHEQPHLVGLFAIHRDSPGAARQLVASSPLLTPLMNTGSHSSLLVGVGVGGGGGGGGGSNSGSSALGALSGVGGSGGGSGGGGGGLAIATGISGAAPGGSGTAGRFDAASLGEKLLSAARDGVDRLGTGTPGGGGGGGGGSGGGTSVLGGSPGGVDGGVGGLGATALEKVAMNENLKSIGNFFRRDIGGLGARFGKRDVTPTGQGDDGRH